MQGVCQSRLCTTDTPYYTLFCVAHTTTAMRLRSWLRHYARSRKVAGSSPDEVDIFNLRNPSSRVMALGLTQPLTEMSTKNLPGGQRAAGV
jgi:hypothetical protein